jgi:hypothetical protein
MDYRKLTNEEINILEDRNCWAEAQVHASRDALWGSKHWRI